MLRITHYSLILQDMQNRSLQRLQWIGPLPSHVNVLFTQLLMVINYSADNPVYWLT